MKVETYRCDVCGKHKGDVNHWFTSITTTAPIPSEGEPIWSIAITQWDEFEAVENSDLSHLCGAECVIKKVNEFLSKKASEETK